MNGEDYSIILPVEVAKRIIYILHHEPYADVVDLLDQLNYAVKHQIQNKNLLDD